MTESNEAKASFISQLRASLAIGKPVDPWFAALKAAGGKRGSDGVYRISTESLYELLEVPCSLRNADAGKRVRAAMIELGWTPVRARDVTRQGRAARVRGYARL